MAPNLSTTPGFEEEINALEAEQFMDALSTSEEITPTTTRRPGITLPKVEI